MQMSEDREALVKASHAQKQRARKFQAAADKSYTQLREKVRPKELLLESVSVLPFSLSDLLKGTLH